MTKNQKAKYRDPELLKDILHRELRGKKFILDCGHHVTFHEVLGNNVTIFNGKELKIICAQCGY